MTNVKITFDSGLSALFPDGLTSAERAEVEDAYRACREYFMASPERVAEFVEVYKAAASKESQESK